MSCRECLRHELFDDVRVEALERGAPYQVFLDCDGMDMFSYSADQDNFCQSIEQYIALIGKET